MALQMYESTSLFLGKIQRHSRAFLLAGQALHPTGLGGFQQTRINRGELAVSPQRGMQWKVWSVFDLGLSLGLDGSWSRCIDTKQHSACADESLAESRSLEA